MLVLSRKEGEKIMIEDGEGQRDESGNLPVILTITLVEVRSKTEARIGITASQRYIILREGVSNIKKEQVT